MSEIFFYFIVFLCPVNIAAAEVPNKIGPVTPSNQPHPTTSFALPLCMFIWF